MKFGEMYPKTYLSGSDLEEESYKRIIIDFQMKEVHDQATGKDVQRPVITFDKPVGSGFAENMILNITNAKSLCEILDSSDTDFWLNQQVTIYRREWNGQPVVRFK
jgi:hypothetical protein